VESRSGHNVAEGQAMIRAARKYNKIMAVGTQQRSSSHFQKAVEIVQSGKTRQDLLGADLELREHQPHRMANTPMARLLPTSIMTGGSDPRLSGHSTRIDPPLVSLVLRLRRGMMSDWGVHLKRHRALGLKAKGPKSVCTTGGIFTTDDDRDTPDTLQVVYEFPECTLTYSMRKGNGLKLNGHDYGILFYGTDGSLLLDRGGFEVIPDKVVFTLRDQTRSLANAPSARSS